MYPTFTSSQRFSTFLCINRGWFSIFCCFFERFLLREMFSGDRHCVKQLCQEQFTAANRNVPHQGQNTYCSERAQSDVNESASGRVESERTAHKKEKNEKKKPPTSLQRDDASCPECVESSIVCSLEPLKTEHTVSKKKINWNFSFC